MYHGILKEKKMADYTYPSYLDRSDSELPGYQRRPIRVWFEEMAQVYHAEVYYGIGKKRATHELGVKTLEKLKETVELSGALPDDIFESLANDSADLRKRQANNQKSNQKSPLVLYVERRRE